MKLIKFDATNSASKKLGYPAITFADSGVIVLNGQFLEDAGINGTPNLSIVQDEESTEDWYLLVGDPDGFASRKKDEKHLTFNSSYIAKSVIKFLSDDADVASVRCRLSVEPADIPADQLPKKTKAYLIITVDPSINKREERNEQ